MTIIERVRNELLKIIQDLDLFNKEQSEINFVASFIDSKHREYGEISTNIALILAKELKQNPKDIALRIVKEIKSKIENDSELEKLISEVNLANNNFINFALTNEAIIQELEKAVNLKNIATKFSNQKILIEHSSPNLFKPFHIGHLMNNIIGEATTEMLKTTKSEIKVASFLSDISLGIAKAIYILKNKKN